MKKKLVVAAVAAALGISLVSAGAASAETTVTTAHGTWSAYPGASGVTYQTSVQQPINLDGSSNFKGNGKSVIPVKFSLNQSSGPFVFESIGSDQNTDNDYSFVSFTPAAPVLFSEITKLSANYAFTAGNCHGGSLRWSVRVSSTQSVFIYYGGYPNFTDCTTESGVNLIDMDDLRFDTTQVGGTFYDDHAGAVTLVGDMPIMRASLVLDSGWGGDQRVTLNGASFGTAGYTDTFTPPAASTAPTCDLPNAEILVTRLTGAATGTVNEPATIQPQDNNGMFRVVDCKYMYNLATSSLSGPGKYHVQVVIDDTPVSGEASFDIR